MMKMKTRHAGQLAAGHPRARALVAGTGTLVLTTLILLFGWNGFVVPVFELARLEFGEALALTLLLAAAGRLLAPRGGPDRAHGPTP